MTRHEVTRTALRSLAVLSLLLCPVRSASAADGWYVVGTGGKAWFADDPFEGAVSGLVTQTFDGEYGLCGGSGYAFAGNPLRVDGEACLFRAGVDSLRNTLTTFRGGSDRHVAGLANLYYAPDLGARTEPYAGIGVGFDVERWGLDLTTPAGVQTTGRFDTRTFFAYQIKAGLAHGVTERVSVIAGYRYFRTQARELNSPSAQVRYAHSAQGIHLIELGVRWNR